MQSDTPQTTAWERCTKGSCHRHQDCMYTPCRAVKVSEQKTDPALSYQLDVAREHLAWLARQAYEAGKRAGVEKVRRALECAYAKS